MAVSTIEDLMAVGRWSADVDYSPTMYDELVDTSDEHKPRKHHLLIYRNDVLVYVGVLLEVTPRGTDGLTIGGVGALWHLGASDVGPVVADREYVSGADKLSNGNFDLGDLYWRRPSEGSSWTFTDSKARKDTSTVGDDVLESDERFPTRPGYTYRATASAMTATGRIRLRIVMEGNFDPPNLLANPGFELGAGAGWGAAANLAIVNTGARTGTYSMRISPIPRPLLVTNPGFESGTTGWTLTPNFVRVTSPTFAGAGSLALLAIPKPQLVVNPAFTAGTGWTVAPAITIINSPGNAYAGAGWVMALAPNPQPQYIADPNFNSGGVGWVDASESPGDMGFVNNGEGFGGSVMRAGPMTQKQLLSNNLKANLSGYYMNSNVADPEPGLFYFHPTDGVSGQGAATTDGAAHPRTVKYLRSDPVPGGGPEEFDVKAGEAYEFEAMMRRSPDANGHAYLSLAIPHPTDIAAGMRWHLSREFDSRLAGETHTHNSVSLTIPANRFNLNALMEVHDHTVGYWSFSEPRLLRTRGNRARIVSTTAYAVSADNEYRIAGDIRTANDQSIGTVTIGVILRGPGMADLEIGDTHGSTDYVWHRIFKDVRPPAGYTTATPFVSALDIIGESAWIDMITFSKVSNNTAEATGAAVTVTPQQRYTLTAPVRSESAVIGGQVTVGVRLTGPGVATEVQSFDVGPTKNEWANQSIEVRPQPGYTTATPFVRSTDIQGASFYVGRVQLIKADNNTDQASYAPLSVSPESNYQLGATIRSDLATTDGSVEVAVRLTGPGVPDKIESASHGLTKGDWISVTTDVRPPLGYTTASIYLLSRDIDGGNFYVDDVQLTKLDNNSDSSEGTAITVIPQRRFRLSMMARSGPNLLGGTVRMSVRATRAGHPDWIQDSPALEATLGDWKLLTYEFATPSGYGTVYPSIIGTDVAGDSWYLDDGEMRDADTSTWVVDATADNPVGATFHVDAAAPVGAEFVRVQLVAEDGSTAWTDDGIALARTGVTPATGNAIVAELLTDPATGAPLSVAAGVVSCPEVIPYDWQLYNMTNRDALDRYCRVISAPVREYRVRHTLPPTIDVGTPESVFVDHAPGTADPRILVPTNRDVDDLTGPSVNVEERPTEIKLVGADRQTVSGQVIRIEATAAVPGATEQDWNGRPIARTKIVTDGTVDHFRYAEALAADLARREESAAITLDVTLWGADAPDCPPGDWVYAYHPESGLENTDYATMVDGEPVFPRRVRVFSRARDYGPSYVFKVRRSNGSTFDLDGVLPSSEDKTTIVVGDHWPEWVNDPQAPAAAAQYVRDRASAPR